MLLPTWAFRTEGRSAMKGISKFTLITAIALAVMFGLGRAGFGYLRRKWAT
jgi:hypothetical protein